MGEAVNLRVWSAKALNLLKSIRILKPFFFKTVLRKTLPINISLLVVNIIVLGSMYLHIFLLKTTYDWDALRALLSNILMWFFCSALLCIIFVSMKLYPDLVVSLTGKPLENLWESTGQHIFAIRVLVFVARMLGHAFGGQPGCYYIGGDPSQNTFILPSFFILIRVSRHSKKNEVLF